LLAAGAQSAVAEVELLAEGGAEDFRSGLRLAGSGLWSSARSHLPAGEVDDADSQAVFDKAGDRAAARQLDVVCVRAEEDRVNPCFLVRDPRSARSAFLHQRLTILNVSLSSSTSSMSRS